jgi:LuxR family maltose regulon positive regulatory protein
MLPRTAQRCSDEGGQVPDKLQSLVMLKARPPTVPPGLVARPRLDAALSRAVSKPLTLVSAGPGAGKTLAVAAWANRGGTGLPVAWLSLDTDDNQPRSFWSGVLAALAESGAVPASSHLNDIKPAAQFGVQGALEVRSRLAELPAPVILVIDDFHQITDDAVLTSMERLIEAQPPQLHVVILTRADPALRLHRLRVAGQLEEIRTGDLAFTEPETAEMFRTQGIVLRPEQVDALWTRTEGWPAGLRLAAMSLDPGDVGPGIARFSGSERSVADYLVGEVIDRLPVAEREFLLRTCVTERVSGELADRLTDRSDGQVTMEALVASNSFVVALGSRSEWFAYHPLLRELLRHRLSLERPTLVPELHRRVAQWMAERGEPIESIRHWILAGDVDGAGRVLIAVLPRLLSPDGPALTAVLEPLARTAVDTPTLAALLASAGRHFTRHDLGGVQRDVVEARQFLDQAPPEARASTEAVLSSFEMAVARGAGDSLEVARIATGIVDLLDRTPRRSAPASRQYRVIAVNNLGGALVWTGEFTAAEQQLAAAEQDAQDLALEMVHLNVLGHRAVVDALRGRCRQADRRAREAGQMIERRGWSAEPQALAAFLALAMVQLARGQWEVAGGNVDRGLSNSARHTDRSSRLALAVCAVQLAVARGDLPGAFAAQARLRAGLDRTPQATELLVRWAAVAGAEALLAAGRPAEVIAAIADPGQATGFAATWERLVLARAYLATSQLRSADRLIEPLLETGAEFVEPAVGARLIQAQIAERQHRDAAALAAVTAAIELAQPDSLRRPFLLLPGSVGLLQRYLRLGGKHAAFAGDLAERLTPGPVASADDELPIEHLTERELIVLHYLPTMLKAGEIASDLYVSVNTVKAHLRSMYRKLGVSNRREAVERARKVGLLH